ncbi:MAG: hypothetical protein ABIP74_00515 [Candidatus Saccharimonas sp.]
MAEYLKSEKVVVSAPLSFAGSAQRLWKITNTSNTLLKWLLLVPIALTLIACAWMFVCFWYVIMYVVFGIFFIPFRLWRRGARKNKRNNLRHREVLSAIEKDQR